MSRLAKEKKLAELMARSNPFGGAINDDTRFAAKTARDLAFSLGDSKGYEQAIFNIAHIYRQQSQYQLAKSFTEEEIKKLDAKKNPAFYLRLSIFLMDITSINFSLDEAVKLQKNILKNIPSNDTSKRVGVFYAISTNIYAKNGNHAKAFESIGKAIEIFKSLNDDPATHTAYNTLGSLYFQVQEYDKAKASFNEVLSKLDYKDFKHTEATIFCNLINLEIRFEKYDLAKKLISKTKDIKVILAYDKIYAQVKMYEADLLHFQKNYSQALRCLDEAQEKIKPLSLDPWTITILEKRAQVFKENKEYFKEARTLGEALKLAKKIKHDKTIITLLKSIADNLKAQNQLDKAWETIQEYIEKSQELRAKESKQLKAEMQVKFETSQKEKEAEELKTESLKFQLQSLRSQMNPHFVFNAISSISDDMKPESVNESKGLLKSFARIMRANLDFAEREKISLEEEVDFLKDYLNLEKNRLKGKFDFDISYEGIEDPDFIEIPSMLLQPYVENSIKHGIMPLNTKGFIRIKFTELEDYLIATIEDNGIGREKAMINKGKQEKHLGKSTGITSKRLSLLSNENFSEIRVQYEDLTEVDNAAVGTLVKLEIKL